MTDSLDRDKLDTMKAVKQQIARMRQELDVLEQLIEDAETDERFDADHDAWIERNKDALNESIREGRAAIARGEGITLTPDELFARIVGEARASADDR